MRYEKKETILRIENVSLELDNRLILREVQAEIKNIRRPDCVQGQVVGFLGPSGIGKTQLSKIISGLQPPTRGDVVIGPHGERVHKGRVGMVAQNYLLFEWATVLDNFLIAGRQAKLTAPEARDKAQGFIQEFKLGEYLKLYPAQLSGGTRQRVAIVQQLMCSEHLLIMDEPFSGLDMIMKRKACELITEVADRDELNTIIVVTHDVIEAASIADTLWLMGYESNGDGSCLPGARLVEQYDLAALDLCWHPDITKVPRFQEFVGEVKRRFETLKTF